MSNKIIYFDYDRGRRINSDGTEDGINQRIGYQEAPDWEIRFKRIEGSVVSAVDVSDALTWEAAIDDDFDHATDVMARTLNANIDSTNASTGIIVVSLDADTSTWETAVGSTAKIASYFRLKGLDASSNPIHRAFFEIVAENDIDPAGGVAPSPSGLYYTKTESDARFVPKVLDTEKTLTDNSTVYISLGAAATYRAWILRATIDDGTNYALISEILVYHNGSTATTEEFPGFIGDDFSGTIVFDAEYNSGTPRLKITTTAHGSSPKMVYEIIGLFAIST